MKHLSSYFIILIVAIYFNKSMALFHQTTQSRQSTGQPAALYSHFGQPSSASQLANLTSASHFTQPFYYEYENRDPRQWLGGYTGGGYSSPWAYGAGNSWLSNGFGSIEAFVVCLLVIVGIGVLGFPLMLLLFSLFSTGLGTQANGFNFIPPSSTTTVNGRRKRSTNESDLSPSLMKRLLEINSVNDFLALKELSGLSEIVMANVKPEIREKAIQAFRSFTTAPDKIEYLKKIVK